MESSSGTLFAVTVEAEHRDAEGNLISRSVSIQAPSAPQCFRFSCLWRFYRKVVLSWLVGIYHCRRVTYAEKKRHKNIAMKYRTGEGAPESVKQALWAIFKLKMLSLFT